MRQKTKRKRHSVVWLTSWIQVRVDMERDVVKELEGMDNVV